jgi:ribonucleotide reductase alpha subunit
VQNQQFDFDTFGRVVEQVVYNLDRVVDTTYYPLKETRLSNERHRNLGIGVQGLGDVFQMLDMVYESEACVAFDALMFECMYFHALTASCKLAEAHGPHPSYSGSPMSMGVLHHDTYGVPDSPRFEWATLRRKIAKHGVRHAHLIALMPTASTAQILGNSEGMEPRTSNLYTRRVLSGEFIVENHVLKQLCKKVPGLWRRVRSHMMRNYGSVQQCDGSSPQNPDLPNRAVFKTAWEISNKAIIQHAAARQPFVCQSQSMNLYLDAPRVNQVSAMHIYAWKSKLKTGMYYLRTKPKANAIQFTCDSECLSCGS